MSVRKEYVRFLADASKFMSEFNLSEGYFGLAASSNGRLIERLKAGGRVWPEQITKAESYMKYRRSKKKARAAHQTAG